MGNNTPKKWERKHTAGVILTLVAVVLVGLFPWLGANDGSNHKLHNVLVWLAIVVLLTLSLVIIGYGNAGRAAGVIIDTRNQMSLSRVQEVAWTILVLSAILTIAMFNIRIGTVD